MWLLLASKNAHANSRLLVRFELFVLRLIKHGRPSLSYFIAFYCFVEKPPEFLKKMENTNATAGESASFEIELSKGGKTAIRYMIREKSFKPFSYFCRCCRQMVKERQGIGTKPTNQIDHRREEANVATQ